MTGLAPVAAAAPAPGDDRPPVLRLSVPGRGRARSRGVYLGTNVLTGGGGFAYDPFEAYRAGLVTNPNMLLAGEPGAGKSATAKCFIYRSVGVFGRWVAIADPKGEYLPLAEASASPSSSSTPAARARLNPLDPGPAGLDDDADEARPPPGRRWSSPSLGSVLRRDLTPVEDAVVGWAIDLTSPAAATRPTQPTLADLAAAHGRPDRRDGRPRARSTPTELARAVEAAVLRARQAARPVAAGHVRRPDHRPPRLDGPGHRARPVRRPPRPRGAHPGDARRHRLAPGGPRPPGRPAAPPGARRGLALLGSERTSRYLQACWKLGRAYGVANLAIVHRLSDLRAQADDGTATAKVSMGLLADTQTRVLFRQSTDQVADARTLLGLTTTEAPAPLPALPRAGRCGRSAAAPPSSSTSSATAERAFCDTDARMAGR